SVSCGQNIGPVFRLPVSGEPRTLEDILVIPDQAYIGTVHYAIVVAVERRDLLHTGEPLLAVLRPSSQIFIEWSQVASSHVRANQEAVLAHDIGSRAGGTHHQVELCIIVSLAGDDRFQLDFDVRVSRLNT